MYGPAGGGNDCTIGRTHSTCGVVYELTQSGGTWTIAVLFSFFTNNHTNQNTGGWLPNGNLIVDSAGHVFGTAQRGGPTGNGTVFELTP